MIALFLVLLVAIPPLALLAAGLVPQSFADRHPRVMRVAVGTLVGLGFAAAAVASVLLAMHGPVDHLFGALPFAPAVNVGVYVDALAAVMVLLVGFVVLVITRYAVRYLDGDPGQGRFYHGLAFTTGAVLLLVVSRNLVMFTAAWMLTNIGLNRLLEHYPDRPWAIWAARKNFLISRLGDVIVIVAVALTFWHFGSTDYAVVFAQADALRTAAAQGDGGGIAPVFAVIAMLLVVGAMTKSAQFPFHSWLPDTMEAPTPVSALMHAGIINAGGFLVIRMSPLVTLSPGALDLLTVVGAFTALFGGLVMLSQTSIKRALAFSTIAQMGFMMLQCGLGAFSAALLHIVAHSLYKAHAFLATGSVLDAAARLKTDARPAVSGAPALLVLPVAAAIAVAIGLASLFIADIDIAHKSGGLVLGIVMVIAVTTLVWHGLVSGSVKLALASIAGGFIVSGIYLAAYQGVDSLLASSAVAREALPASGVDRIVGALVVVGFLGVFAIQIAASWLSRLPVVRALYVHSANGFYCDIPARQITARVYGLDAPVP
jgi:NAD(P)H-quinone oxidoreductase subunit 5